MQRALGKFALDRTLLVLASHDNLSGIPLLFTIKQGKNLKRKHVSRSKHHTFLETLLNKDCKLQV